MIVLKTVLPDCVTRCLVAAVVCLVLPHAVGAASVVARPNINATSVNANANRLAVMPGTGRPSMRAAATRVTTPPVVEEVVVKTPEPALIVNPIGSKSEQFTTIFDDAANTANAADDDLADRIRRQRMEISAADIATANASANAALVSATANACDMALRECMAGECGNDFSRCADDGDTVWGGKMESCRRGVGDLCTGEEYINLAAEIKADRDANVVLAAYEAVKTCGETYNGCILRECGGAEYPKCLSKAGGDRAVAACSRDFDACRAADGGLQARAMDIFATLRTGAEQNISKWEKRLLEVRDLMSAECRRTGGALDERTLECVYTVTFAADYDGDLTTFASRKLAAGGEFMCAPDWFGIDITTFKENAARYTRSQTGASNAILGAGLGTAAGAVASGAINRAMDRQSTANAAKVEENKPVRPGAAAPRATTPQTSPVQTGVPAAPSDSDETGSVAGGDKAPVNDTPLLTPPPIAPLSTAAGPDMDAERETLRQLTGAVAPSPPGVVARGAALAIPIPSPSTIWDAVETNKCPSGASPGDRCNPYWNPLGGMNPGTKEAHCGNDMQCWATACQAGYELVAGQGWCRRITGG